MTWRARASTRRRCPDMYRSGPGGPTSTRSAVVNSAYRPVVFWNGRADSLWALNVVVAESPTTLNGNRLRTAHQIADRYSGALRSRVRDALWAPGHRRRSTSYRRTASRVLRPCHLPTTTRSHLRRQPLPRLRTRRGQRPLRRKARTQVEDERRKPKAMVTRILVNWAKAIAAYEYKLNSTKSAFDKFVAAGPGSGVISAAAKRGARLFVGKAGCVDCHLGPQFTDDQFHNIGVPQTGVTVPLVADCPMGNLGCDCSPNRGEVRTLGRVRRPAAPQVEGRNRWLRTGRWSGQPGDHSRDSYVQRAADRRPQGGVANAEPAQRRVDRALHARRALRHAGGRDLALQHRRSERRRRGGEPGRRRGADQAADAHRLPRSRISSRFWRR